MRFVLKSGNALELNFMWLPTWIGESHAIKLDIEKQLGPKLVGKEFTDDVLDEANQMVIDMLCEKFKVPGLRHYLDGIKFIGM